MKNSDRQGFEMVDLMSFMCDIRNKDMGLKALKDAGAEAIKGIDIPGIVSGFFNSKKSNKNTQQSLDNYVNYF